LLTKELTGNYRPSQIIDHLRAIGATATRGACRQSPQFDYGRRFFKDARQTGAEKRRAMPIAGDDADADAKSIVFGFVNKLGFEPVDAGGLA